MKKLLQKCLGELMHKEEELFDHVYVWADGSIRGNPDGEGGLGILIESKRLNFVKAIGIHKPEREGNTNNRMELEAVIEAFKALKEVPLVVHLFLDSMYVIGGIRSKGYQTNKDLWRKLFHIINNRTVYVNVQHVKGHSGIQRNVVVDRLANLAREKQRDVEFVGHPEEIIRKFSK